MVGSRFMVFHTNPCNFEIFKTVMKYFLKHHRAQISFYFIKAIRALKCVKERFNESFKILEFTRRLYGKPCKRDWMAKFVYLKQMFPTFGGRCNRYFWDIQLKLLRLPNFNMLLQPVQDIFQKWTVFVFTESWSRDQVMQRAYYLR